MTAEPVFEGSDFDEQATGDCYGSSDKMQGGDIEEVDQQWESARFLLRMTEEHSLTHTGVDSFCESTQWFVENVCSQIKSRIATYLAPSVDSSLQKDILAACNPGDLFAGLKSRYNREKFYRDHFNYVVRMYLYMSQVEIQKNYF